MATITKSDIINILSAIRAEQFSLDEESSRIQSTVNLLNDDLQNLKQLVADTVLLETLNNVDLVNKDGELSVRFKNKLFSLRGPKGDSGTPEDISEEIKRSKNRYIKLQRELNEIDNKMTSFEKDTSKLKKAAELSAKALEEISSNIVPTSNRDLSNEFDTLRNEITMFRSRLITDMNNKLSLHGGAPAGGGEVNLKFLDDVDFDSADNAGGVMYFDAATQKFKFADKITIEGDVLNIDSYSLLSQSITTTSDAIDINYANGNFIDLSLTQNVNSISVTSWPSAPEVGKITIFIRQTNGGNHLINAWPSGTKFPDSIAPILSTANGSIDVVILTSVTGGVEVIGTAAGENYGIV